MKILINSIAAKKHAGGVYQITQNFLLKTLDHPEIEWYYFTSKDVDEAIGSRFKELIGSRYFVFPTQPVWKDYIKTQKSLHKLEMLIKADVIYSIAAPSYFSFKTKEVMRFTLPWATHPNKYAWSVIPVADRLNKYLHIAFAKKLIRSTKYFITQTETCKKGIIKITGVPGENVKVVSNVLPATFLSMDRTHIHNNQWIDIACVGNPFPHKNFEIVPSVVKELNNLGYSDIRFHLTIPEQTEAWKYIDKKIKTWGIESQIVNHGRISQQELGKVYQECQLCFLPTLLEVFSASTVEAMFFNLPVVATDFDFNRDVFDDSCLYFHPRNAKDAANKIVELVKDESLQTICRKKMHDRLNIYGDYDSHFNSILSFLVDCINK